MQSYAKTQAVLTRPNVPLFAGLMVAIRYYVKFCIICSIIFCYSTVSHSVLLEVSSSVVGGAGCLSCIRASIDLDLTAVHTSRGLRVEIGICCILHIIYHRLYVL